MSTRIGILRLAAALSVGVLTLAVAVAVAAPGFGSSARSSGFGSAMVGSASVGRGPGAIALDPATQTIYVTNGGNPNGPNAGGDTVSVIDARRCNVHALSRCRGPWPTITVGSDPGAIAIDESTDTVYVNSSNSDSISVFNGATCNATDTSGCWRKPAKVRAGLHPTGLFADSANHTVYVANAGAAATGGAPGNSTTVSMINSATCNATDLSSCPTSRPTTVKVGGTPEAVVVDPDTHTVYVTTIGKGRQNGWSVFDANTCNATVQSGCAALGRLPGDPSGPYSAEIDPANDTLYTANYDNTISAFDLSRCNAADLRGCASDKPGTVTAVPNEGFSPDLWLAVDTALHTVYVTFQKDDALMVINTDACGRGHLKGCSTLKARVIHTGTDPEEVVLDLQTQTLYTTDEVDNSLAVIDPTRCDAARSFGCRRLPPQAVVPDAGGVTADPAVSTAYVTSGTGEVAMINTRTCNAARAGGCSRTPATFRAGAFPSAIAVNPVTHTVYIVNHGAKSTGTVSLINDRTCNATSRAGCTKMSTLRVPGGNPDAISVNPVTDTVYVVTIAHSATNLVSVFNGATCNAADTTGCHQTPASVPTGTADLGQSLGYVAVDDDTNTVYATNGTLGNPFMGNRVYVINGKTCDAADPAGCRRAPATVTAGFNSWGIAVDQQTDTIYTANIANGEGPGTVSMINGSVCNGERTSGCQHLARTIAAGFGANGIAIQPTTDRVYAANIEDSSVSVINGATCNAHRTSGCGQDPPRVSVGDYPSQITVDPAARTAYVQTSEGVSVIPLTK